MLWVFKCYNGLHYIGRLFGLSWFSRTKIKSSRNNDLLHRPDGFGAPRKNGYPARGARGTYRVYLYRVNGPCKKNAGRLVSTVFFTYFPYIPTAAISDSIEKRFGRRSESRGTTTREVAEDPPAKP